MMVDGDVVGHSRRPTCFGMMDIGNSERGDERVEVVRVWLCEAILRDCGTGSDGTKHGRKRSGKWGYVEDPRDTLDVFEEQRSVEG